MGLITKNITIESPLINMPITMDNEYRALAGFEVFVFFMWGQSNMVGANDGSSLPSEYTEQQDGKIYYGPNKRFELLEYNVNNSIPISNNNVGPEIGFVNELAKSYPNNKIYIIKYADGGTGIKIKGVSDWNINSVGELYDIFEELYLAQGLFYVQAETGLGKRRIALAGIIQSQGEADSADADAASYYETDLARIYDGWIQKIQDNGFDTSILQKVIIKTSNEISGGSYPQKAVIRAAQENIADYIIDADDLPLADGLHWNASNQIIVGQRTAEPFKTLIPAYSKPPTYSLLNEKANDLVHILNTEPATQIKEALNIFITDCETDGNWDKIDFLMLPMDTEANYFIDAMDFNNRVNHLRTYVGGNGTFIPNIGVSLNGSNYINLGFEFEYTESFTANHKRNSKDDWFMGVHVVSNGNVNGNACLFGNETASAILLVQQPGSNRFAIYAHTDAFEFYTNGVHLGADDFVDFFQDDKFYTLFRSDANNNGLLIDGELVFHGTSVSKNANFGNLKVGTRDGSQNFTGTIGAIIKGVNTGFDHVAFDTAYRKYLSAIA